MIVEINTEFSEQITDSALQRVDEQLVQLDGVEYLLRFVWAPREQAYYLSLLDQDENPLALSIRLNINAPLLRRFRDPRLPPGSLLCVDLSDRGAEITQPSDLGQRVILAYVTADEP